MRHRIIVCITGAQTSAALDGNVIVCVRVACSGTASIETIAGAPIPGHKYGPGAIWTLYVVAQPALKSHALVIGCNPAIVYEVPSYLAVANHERWVGGDANNRLDRYLAKNRLKSRVRRQQACVNLGYGCLWVPGRAAASVTAKVAVAGGHGKFMFQKGVVACRIDTGAVRLARAAQRRHALDGGAFDLG